MEVKVKPKTFTYDVDVRWTSERKGKIEADGKPSVEVATPPEFKGHAGIWSPEDLFVSAVNVCTMTTFVGMAARRGLRFQEYRARATGTLEKVDEKFLFTEIVVRPTVTVGDEADIETARTTLHDAEAACLIANSIKTRVRMEETIQVAGAVLS